MDKIRNSVSYWSVRYWRLLQLFAFSLMGFFMVSGLMASGCQRSPAFKRDEGLLQNEPPSYYARGGEGRGEGGSHPTSRIEKMGQPKKRLMVLDFLNDTPVKVGDLGRFAADELKRFLHSTQRVILPPEIKPELGTPDVLQGGEVKLTQLIREGKRMGVSVLLIGRVSKAVFRQRGDDAGLFRQKQSLAAVDVEVKLFDVMSSREILSTGKSAESSSNAIVTLDGGAGLESSEFRAELLRFAVRNAVDLLVGDVIKAIEKMTWQGHIAKMTGNKVYINAGKVSGLLVGDILKVITLGEEIYDPQTGAYLGRSDGRLKGTVEVMDFIGPDGALAHVHTGGGFQVGDQVQLY